jgi:hypothetical protein
MINFNRAYGSFRKGQDDLSRKRREIAQAFTEFKSANPYANMDDFQYFIDSNVDLGMGSNYLRGGAPSRQILDKIAGENEQNRVRAEKKKVLADSIEQGEFSGRLQGAADKLLLENNGDTNKTMAALRGMFGDRIDYGALGITDNYIGKRYDELIQTRLQDPTNITNLTGYLNALSLSELENLDGSQLKGIFDLPEDTSDTHLQSALARAKEAKQTKQLAQNKEIMAMVEAAAERGDTKVTTVIRNYFGGGSITDDRFAELTKNMDFKAYQDRADKIVSDRKEATYSSAAIKFNNLTNTLRNRPDFKGYIRANDKASALAILVNEIQSGAMTPSEVTEFFGGDGVAATNAKIAQEFDMVYTAMEQNQIGDLVAKRSQEIANAGERSIAEAADNVARMQKMLTLSFDKDVADAIGSMLGGQYRADQVTRGKILRAAAVANDFRNENEAATPEQLLQKMQEVMGAPDLREYIDAKIQNRLENMPSELMTMDEYQQKELEDLAASDEAEATLIDNLNKDLNDAKTIDEAKLIIEKAKAEKERLKLWETLNAKQQGMAESSAWGTDDGNPIGWLKAGNELDPTVFGGINKQISVSAGNFTNKLDYLISIAETKITSLELDAAEAAAEAPETEPFRNPDESAAYNEWVSRWQRGEVGSNLKTAIRGKSVLNPIPTAVRDNFMLTESEKERRQAVEDWAYEDDTWERLKQYGNLLKGNQFHEEQFRNIHDYNILLQDLEKMTADELGAKYTPIFESL